MTIAMLTFVGKAYAEMSFGVSAAITKIDASGTETEGGEKNKGDANNTTVIPSVFVEYAFSDAVSIGLDYIPLSADVSDKAKSTFESSPNAATFGSPPVAAFVTFT